MSETTLATPVHPAIKPWYSHLLFDPWIGLSWFVFAGTGLMSVLLMFAPRPQPVAPPPPPPPVVSRGTSRSHATPSQTLPAPVTPAPVAMVKPHVTFAEAAGRFVYIGYVFWSLYFGWAACCRLLARGASGFFQTGSIGIFAGAGIGCIWTVVLGVMLFVLGSLYSWFGGGLFHFCRRWWLLAHGRRPSFLRSGNRTEAVNERLARLDELWHNGRVTRPEYDQQRAEILRSL